MEATVQLVTTYLDKEGLSVYAPTLQSPLRFPFPKELVQDMEVIDADGLVKQLSDFLIKYEVPQGFVIILISQSLLFMQDIATTVTATEENTPPQPITAIEQQKKIQDFLDTVPFEIIEQKSYPIDNGIRVIATNKALYEGIVSAFEKQGSQVKTVIPALILGIPNEGLNDETITAVMNNYQALRQESFLIHPEDLIIPMTSEEKKKAFLSMPKQQAKLYAYTGVFVVLLGVFGFMYKTMLDQNVSDQQHTVAYSPPIRNNPVTAATPTTAAIPIGSFVASNSATSNKSAIAIQIQTNTATTTQGELIKNKLSEKGYTNITLTQIAPTTAKTLLLFSPSVDPATQAEITNVISNIFTNFATQQSAQTQYNVTIIPSANP